MTSKTAIVVNIIIYNKSKKNTLCILIEKHKLSDCLNKQFSN